MIVHQIYVDDIRLTITTMNVMYIMHGNNDDDRAGFDVSVSDLAVCDSDMALSSETT